MQSGSPVKPLTVNAAGTGGVSPAGADAGRIVPFAQDRLTVTVPAGRSGTKFLFTVNGAVARVLVIVQEPGAVPLQVPGGVPLAV